MLHFYSFSNNLKDPSNDNDITSLCIDITLYNNNLKRLFTTKDNIINILVSRFNTKICDRTSNALA